MVVEGRLSSGHAKALLGLDIAEEQVLYARRAVREAMSVRQLEKAVEATRRAPRRRRIEKADLPGDYLAGLLDVLHRHFGTSVRVQSCRTLLNGKKARGCIEIDFYTAEDLDRILQVLGVAENL